MSLIGRTAEATQAPLSPEDGRSAVSASTRVVSLMELAAARLMRPQLTSDQSSVAVEMNVKHLVAEPTGELRAVAVYLGVTGRLHHFRVDAFDEDGLIGASEHTRAVVNPRRLLAGARRRAGRPAMLLNV